MSEKYELLRIGHCLRVLLPDALPPDWDAIESDLCLELNDGGVLEATVVAPRHASPTLVLDAALRIASVLERHGVRVRIEPRPDEPFGHVDVAPWRQSLAERFAA